MTAFSAMGPLGFRSWEVDRLWEVLIYPRPVELVGGADDGEVLAPAFSVDIEDLRSLFDRVDALSWHMLGLSGGEGRHVSIEGLYRGHEAYVQVQAYATGDEEPGMKVQT